MPDVIKKKLYIKVYTASGQYIGMWRNASFQGFAKEINAGLGECVIDLGEVFDYGGADLALNNLVEIWVGDENTLASGELIGARLMYKGYISMVEPHAEARSEGVLVHLLGLYTLLSVDVLKNGATTTLYTHSSTGLTTTGPGSAADVGLIMRAIIDRYRAETVGPQINYSGSNIPLTGTTALYKFEQKMYREALDKVKDMGPANYYWYLGEDGLLNFKAKPTEATHDFFFGKHLLTARVQRSMEKIRNFILVFDGGSLYKHYQDDASIALYGRRVERKTDYGIQDVTAQDKIGEKFLAENKLPEIKVTCEISATSADGLKGYNIESVNPGDTCSFFNFNDTLAEVFRENMLITRVQYNLDRITIDAEVTKAGLLDWQDATARNVDDIETTGSPAAYT